MTTTFFLGTNPVLSASECIALLHRLGIAFELSYADARIVRITTEYPIPKKVGDFLGGTFRITEDIASWNHIPSAEEVLSALSPLPEKWVVGVSSINVTIPLRHFGVSLKKAARAQGSKLSFIEPKHGAHTLNAAQVLFNKLDDAPNADLTIMKLGDKYILIKTTHVQDISAYELRDTSRPARDARVGMLPPKLAQIMINLGASSHNATIYDPFCGMGTILQEAWNMGFTSIGSDASERMVAASEKNLSYLAGQFPVSNDHRPEVFLHDVQEAFPERLGAKNINIVTEPFLGTPLTHPLSSPEIEIFHNSIINLYSQFFRNIRKVLEPGATLLILLPCPKGPEGFSPLPRTFIDEIASIGYRKKQLVPQELASQFSPESSEPVLYARPDALVAREVTLWEACV